MKQNKEKRKMIGDKTPYGKVSAIGIVGGERYYWCVKNGVVSMMPSDVINSKLK